MSAGDSTVGWQTQNRVFSGIHAEGLVRLTVGLVGTLLAFSSGLKAHQVTDGGFQFGGVVGWSTIGIVAWEICLSIALLARVFPRHIRQAALATFSCFAIVSATKIVRGESTCDCFGSIAVPTALSLSLDFLAIAVLVFWRTSVTKVPSLMRLKTDLVIAVASASCTFFSAFPLSQAWGQWQSQARLSTLQKELQLHLVRAFPFDLGVGEWEVTLLRQSCPACEAWMRGVSTGPPTTQPTLVVMVVDDIAKPFASASHKQEADGENVVAFIFSDADALKGVPTPVRVRLVNETISLRSVPTINEET